MALAPPMLSYFLSCSWHESHIPSFAPRSVDCFSSDLWHFEHHDHQFPEIEGQRLRTWNYAFLFEESTEQTEHVESFKTEGLVVFVFLDNMLRLVNLFLHPSRPISAGQNVQSKELFESVLRTSRRRKTELGADRKQLHGVSVFPSGSSHS